MLKLTFTSNVTTLRGPKWFFTVAPSFGIENNGKNGVSENAFDISLNILTDCGVSVSSNLFLECKITWIANLSTASVSKPESTESAGKNFLKKFLTFSFKTF